MASTTRTGAPLEIEGVKLRLRNHITIHLAAGAPLIAAEPPPAGQPGGYAAFEPNPWNQNQDPGHSRWRNSLIWGENIGGVATRRRRRLESQTTMTTQRIPQLLGIATLRSPIPWDR